MTTSWTFPTRTLRTLIGAGAIAGATLLAGCGSSDDDGADAPVVAIELGRYTIDPVDLTITAGPATLQVTNVDSIPHNLVVAGKGTRNVAPGETQAISAEIAPGDYRMWCDIAGHADLGQVGILRAAIAPAVTTPATTTGN